MSRGRYLSLEEARNYGEIDRFAEEHPSEGDRVRFNRLEESGDDLRLCKFLSAELTASGFPDVEIRFEW